MGSIVWTLITYFSTFGIAFVAFRLVLADKQDATGAPAVRPAPKPEKKKVKGLLVQPARNGWQSSRANAP